MIRLRIPPWVSPAQRFAPLAIASHKVTAGLEPGILVFIYVLFFAGCILTAFTLRAPAARACDPV
jgi:hypothetical protein